MPNTLFCDQPLIDHLSTLDPAVQAQAIHAIDLLKEFQPYGKIIKKVLIPGIKVLIRVDRQQMHISLDDQQSPESIYSIYAIYDRSDLWEINKKRLLKDNPLVRAKLQELLPLGEIINQLISTRKSKGISQEQLARELHTTQSVIARFESGIGNISIENLDKIARALRVQLKISLVGTKD